jgi:hypothetical protein
MIIAFTLVSGGSVRVEMHRVARLPPPPRRRLPRAAHAGGNEERKKGCRPGGSENDLSRADAAHVSLLRPARVTRSSRGLGRWSVDPGR